MHSRAYVRAWRRRISILYDLLAQFPVKGRSLPLPGRNFEISPPRARAFFAGGAPGAPVLFSVIVFTTVSFLFVTGPRELGEAFALLLFMVYPRFI